VKCSLAAVGILRAAAKQGQRTDYQLPTNFHRSASKIISICHRIKVKVRSPRGTVRGLRCIPRTCRERWASFRASRVAR